MDPGTFYLAAREKIAASLPRYKFLRERMGRRAMRVSTLLKKEKDGSLFKTAKPRLVRAWQEAQKAGDTGLADQYAKAYGDLGLPGRYLNDVSGGGAEAGVDRMMGRAPSGGGHESGYLIRKMYKPDSTMHQGEFTRKTLEQKQHITDLARLPVSATATPASREMVPDMYGFKQHGTDANPRFTSYHEPVQIGRELSGTAAISAGQQAKDTVINPLTSKGLHVGDVASTHSVPIRSWDGVRNVNTDGVGMAYDQFRSTGGLVNPGNLVQDKAGKTKILDFLPRPEGEASTIAQTGEKYYTSQMGSDFRKEKHLGALRKEVHSPTERYRPITNEQMRNASSPASMPASSGSSQQSLLGGSSSAPVTSPTPVPKGSLTPAIASTSVHPQLKPTGLIGPGYASARPSFIKKVAPHVSNMAVSSGASRPALGALSSPFKSLMR